MTLKKIHDTTSETCRGLFLKKGMVVKKSGKINWNALILPKNNPPNRDRIARKIKNMPNSFFIIYFFV